MLPLAQANPAPAGSHVQLFVLAGQSNASGRASIAKEPLPTDRHDAEILFFYDTDTTSAFNGLQNSGGRFVPLGPTPNGVFGLEIGIGRALVAGGAPRPAIVKFSRGGTNLHTDWRPDATSGRRLYAQLLEQVAAATSRLEADGHTWTLAGIFWMQGESDNTHGDAYEANLRAFVARLRRDLRAPEAPFVLGRTGLAKSPDDPGRLAVRAGQMALVAADPRAAWVDADDLTRFDGTHYDGPSTLTLGRRMAEAMLPLLNH
jgi:hypothetical protein